MNIAVIGYGYVGKAMAEFMRKNGVDPIILDAVLKKNKQIRGDRP